MTNKQHKDVEHISKNKTTKYNIEDPYSTRMMEHISKNITTKCKTGDNYTVKGCWNTFPKTKLANTILRTIIQHKDVGTHFPNQNYQIQY